MVFHLNLRNQTKLCFIICYSVEEEEEEDDDDVDIEGDLSHDNWEIQMLAAELNRRQSGRRDDPSAAIEPNAGSSSSASRRQRLRSDTFDTDTENSELEPTERVQRPRAASFDHTSTAPRQRSKGVLKAFSFDRDKDQL